MRFKGQLLLPNEPGPGLRVNLELAGHHLAVISEDGELGAWPLAAVRVRRLEGDTFAMTVAGEDLHFVADDTIGFAYSGLPLIESVTGIPRPRGRIRGLLSRFGPDSPVQVESPPSIEEEGEEEPGQAEPAVFPPEPIATRPAGPETDDDGEDEFIDMALLDDGQFTLLPEPASPAVGISHDEQMAVTEVPPRLEDGEEPSGCPGLTSEGLPCRSPILGPSGYCYNHDPERAAEDGYRKALEARARLRRKATARLTKTYSRLEKAMRQVERGELEPDVAVAMAQIARTMCAILDLDDEEPEGKSDSGLTPRF